MRGTRVAVAVVAAAAVDDDDVVVESEKMMRIAVSGSAFRWRILVPVFHVEVAAADVPAVDVDVDDVTVAVATGDDDPNGDPVRRKQCLNLNDYYLYCC